MCVVKAVGALLQSVFHLFFYGTKFNDIFPVGFEGIKSPAALVKIGIYTLHLLFHFCGGDTARTLQNGFLLELRAALAAYPKADCEYHIQRVERYLVSLAVGGSCKVILYN